MNALAKRISQRWKNYKFRFVPWIVLNVSERNSINGASQDADVRYDRI